MEEILIGLAKAGVAIYEAYSTGNEEERAAALVRGQAMLAAYAATEKTVDEAHAKDLAETQRVIADELTSHSRSFDTSDTKPSMPLPEGLVKS